MSAPVSANSRSSIEIRGNNIFKVTEDKFGGKKYKRIACTWFNILKHRPDIDEEVLTYHHHWKHQILSLQDIFNEGKDISDFGWSDGAMIGNIQYWMPLPKSPYEDINRVD